MNITITLLFQVIAFLIMIWLVRRYMWGPLNNLLEERQKTIQDGLDAAEKGKAEFRLAEERAHEMIARAKEEAQEILNRANKRERELEEESRINAKAATDKQIQKAKTEIQQEVLNAREALRKEIGTLVMSGVKQIIEKEVDEKTHRATIDKLIQKVESA